MYFILAAYALVVISEMDYEEDTFCDIFVAEAHVYGLAIKK